MIPSAAEFVELMRQAARGAQQEAAAPGELRFATVDPAYAGGAPALLFDGESTLSTKTYPVLESYLPAAGDRVALLASPNSALVLGSLGGGVSGGGGGGMRGDWNGATGTDNVTAWNALMAAAAARVRVAGGAEVRIGSGRFWFSRPPNPIPSGVKVHGAGMGMTQLVLADNAGYNYGFYLGYVQGTQPTVASFTPGGAMTQGTATFTIPAGTAGSFAVGQYFHARFQLPYGSFTSRIAAISGSMGAGYTVTMEDYWPITFPATGCTITMFSAYATDIEFTDCEVAVDPLLANSGTPVYCILPVVADGVDGALVERVKSVGSAYYGLYAYQARDVWFRNCRGERAAGGMAQEWCTAGGMTDVRLWRSQFGFVASGCCYLSLDNCQTQSDWQGWPNPPSVNLNNYGRGFKFQDGCHFATAHNLRIADHSSANRIIDSQGVRIDGMTVVNHGTHGASGGVFDHGLLLDGSNQNGNPNLTVGCSINALTVENCTGAALFIASFGSGPSGNTQDTRHSITGLVAHHVNTAGGGYAVALASSGNAIVGATLRDYGTGATGIYGYASTTRNSTTGCNIENGGSGLAIDTSASGGLNQVKVANQLWGEATAYAGSDT